MRAPLAWRLLAASLLLLSLLAALPAAPFPSPAVVFADEERGDDSGEGGNDEDDGEDEDHDNEEKQKEKPDKGKHGKNGKDGDAAVATAAGYTVDVTCAPVTEASQTACTFHAVAPPDGKKVSHVLVPSALACAEVVGGDAGFVNPDPNIHVTGYRATHETFQMVFAGVIETSGVATYWVKAASGVYPATGPGLACLGAESSTQSMPALAATPPPETGTVIVTTYTCPAVTLGTTGIDWFGICAADGAGQRFVMAPTDAGDGTLHAAETIATGMATFSGLPPGAYDLDDPDRQWCHAESDHVTAEGAVVVETGAATTVWLFYCDSGS